MDLIKTIEKSFKLKANINYLPIEKGEVISTRANIEELQNEFDFTPSISIDDGIKNFVSWLKKYKNRTIQN